MAKRQILLLAVISVLMTVMPGSHPAHASTDSRVDQLFTALSDRKFADATQHFDPTMKSALSADQLSAVWLQIGSTYGKLNQWKIIQHSMLTGTDVFSVVLAFEHGKLIATVSVRPQTGEIAGLYFKPMTTKTAASSSPATSPPYANATKFRSEAVTIGDDPWKLPGTLTIPAGNGPFPAVVLLAGSGPHDRDESVGANHVFKDLAEGLSSRGIIVLRYDKRTFAYQTLDPQKTTVKEEIIDDGAAAVHLLRTRPEVAHDRIFVVGHSLGAVMAPEVARKARPVAGIVMLAPNGRKLPAVIVQQVRDIGQASPEQLAELERQANEISEHKMPRAQYFFGAPAAYYYDLDARDEVAIARTLGVPILILHGGRDYQVIDEDISIWQTGLKGDPKVQVKTFPTLNHLFIAGTGKPGPAEYETPGHVDGAVIGAIASFIANASGRRVAGGAEVAVLDLLNTRVESENLH
jgi:dienelactone hydrolase